MGKVIGILGFDEVEALDFVGPYEVFTTAERVSLKAGMGSKFEVVSVSTRRTFTDRAGLSMEAKIQLNDVPKLDVLVIPGGVTIRAERNSELIEWIRKVWPDLELTAAVCTGVFILAAADLLGMSPVTTHWEDIEALRTNFPELQVKENVRWVDSGKVVTSAGISAGIDMSLHLVVRLANRNLALLTARQMDYRWQELEK